MVRDSQENSEEVNKALGDLKKAASTDENLIPYIVEAVKAYASAGEICNTLREVFGEYKEQVVI